MRSNIFFILISLTVYIYIGRKVGWYLSKKIFYQMPDGGALFILLLVWGFIVFIAENYLIDYFQPVAAIKWLIGYGSSLYIACPNYGLLQASTIPESELSKHRIISRTSTIVLMVLFLLGELTALKSV